MYSESTATLPCYSVTVYTFFVDTKYNYNGIQYVQKIITVSSHFVLWYLHLSDRNWRLRQIFCKHTHTHTTGKLLQRRRIHLSFGRDMEREGTIRLWLDHFSGSTLATRPHTLSHHTTPHRTTAHSYTEECSLVFELVHGIFPPLSLPTTLPSLLI